MKRVFFPALLLICVLSAAVSCKREELPEPCIKKGINFLISEYPAYYDTKTIGIPDEGKASWDDEDTLRMILQTESNPVAARYNIIRKSGAWENETSITLPDSPCRALVYYAPAYEFGTDSILSLKKGHRAGVDEFLQWSSGEEYDISDPATTLQISFTRQYSRLRIASENGYTVKMEAPAFIPAGYGTTATGSDALRCIADENGNAFFFGKWPDESSFKFVAYDKEGNYSFSEYFATRPSGEDGKSYALSCMNDGTYSTVAQISKTATSTTATSFNVKVNNVTVSYVNGRYAYLEDESGAVLVSVLSHKLAAGMRIKGSISGKIKLSSKNPTITSLTYSSATVTSDGEIPCTGMTLADLLADFNSNLSRRISLKGVTVEAGTGTESRTGQISQAGSTIKMYSINYSTLLKGATGDLIAFPMLSGTTKQLCIYEDSQFTEQAGEDSPFTNLTAMGYYQSTDTDTPLASRLYVEGEDQYSISESSTSMGWHIFNLEENTFAYMDASATFFPIGSKVDATFTINGQKSVRSVNVVNRTGARVWLEDKTYHDGFILNLE